MDNTSERLFYVLPYIICAIIVLLYYSSFESSGHQATPGKLAVGMIVVDLAGNRI
jgi:uncharacterized RDD family membrane protein YckC